MSRSGVLNVFGKKWVDFHRVVAIEPIVSTDYQGAIRWEPDTSSSNCYCQLALTVEMLDRPIVVGWGMHDWGSIYSSDMGETKRLVEKFKQECREIVDFWRAL